MPKPPEKSAPPAILRSEILSRVPGLLHGFSTRHGGRPGRNWDMKASAAARAQFVRKLGAGTAPLLTLRQIHSDLVWQDPEPGRAGDALISRRPGQLLGVRVADCTPILIVDPDHRAVAAVHAGWRGTAARIAEKAVVEMRAAFGSDPARLLAAIGPGIRRCCYEVGPEVAEQFETCFVYAADLFQSPEDDPVRSRYPMLFMTGAPPGHPRDPRWNRDEPVRLDLAEANRRQLIAAGILPAAVDVLPFCTGCRHDLLYSHRGGDSQRMVGAVGFFHKIERIRVV